MTQTNRSQWDIGRLFKTLTYFEVIPFISCLQRLFTGRDEKQQSSQKKETIMGTILVAGATGGVGKRVVSRLRENNYPVRALVRDAARAKKILGENASIARQ